MNVHSRAALEEAIAAFSAISGARGTEELIALLHLAAALQYLRSRERGADCREFRALGELAYATAEELESP